MQAMQRRARGQSSEKNMISPQQSQRRARAARLAADPGLQPHGVKNTYREWGCRCEPCTQANSAALLAASQDRAARLAANPALRPHGVELTYVSWGCRCRPCRRAHADARAKRRRTTG